MCSVVSVMLREMFQENKVTHTHVHTHTLTVTQSHMFMHINTPYSKELIHSTFDSVTSSFGLFTAERNQQQGTCVVRN